MTNILFRIDDIGASTKHFNQYGKHWIKIFGKKILPVPFSDFWFFKRLPGLRGWAKYDELTAGEWKQFLAIFKEWKIIPVVAITACWVERNGSLVPFPEKFPEEAALLKAAAIQGDIVVANHGLTHCVVGKHLPKLWGSNRKFHREFLPELDESLHREHILKSQQILEGYFGFPVELLVPPGNIWSIKTYRALSGTNIKKILSKKYMTDSDEPMSGIQYIADAEDQFPFHDRELKLYGKAWLQKKIEEFSY